MPSASLAPVIPLLALASAGCMASAAPLVTGNVDTSGRVGAEGAVELTAGITDGPHLAVNSGLGRLGAFDSTHVLIAPSLGFSTVGSSTSVAAGASLPIRFFPGSPEPTRLGGGLQGQVTLKIAHFGHDRSSRLELGPRLGLEAVNGLGAADPGAEPGRGGLFSVGLALRLVSFQRSIRLF